MCQTAVLDPILCLISVTSAVVSIKVRNIGVAFKKKKKGTVKLLRMGKVRGAYPIPS